MSDKIWDTRRWMCAGGKHTANCDCATNFYKGNRGQNEEMYTDLKNLHKHGLHVFPGLIIHFIKKHYNKKTGPNISAYTFW